MDAERGRPFRQYRTQDVDVPGGQLRVGIWEPAADGSGSAGDRSAPPPTALCVHGITSSHLAWTVVADQLPGWRIVAPDLRGRGRSANLPGPYGLARHADDVRAVAAAVIASPASAVLVGHSMGGFVAVALLGTGAGSADPWPGGLVLVDGGLPLPTPPGASGGEEAIRATLGPTADRLRRTFPDRAAYRDFWAAHPALSGPWPDGLAEYFDYDLRAVDPQDPAAGWRPVTDEAAMLADGVEIAEPGGGPALRAGLAALTARWGRAAGDGVVLLRAPRDLLDRPGGMYPPDWAAAHAAAVRGLTVRDVPDTNHYSLLLGGPGAAEVAAAIRAAVPGRGAQATTTAPGDGA